MNFREEKGMSWCILGWNIPYGAQVGKVMEHHRRWRVVKEGSGLEAYTSFQKDPKQTDIWWCPRHGKKKIHHQLNLFFRKLENIDRYIYICIRLCPPSLLWKRWHMRWSAKGWSPTVWITGGISLGFSSFNNAALWMSEPQIVFTSHVSPCLSTSSPSCL